MNIFKQLRNPNKSVESEEVIVSDFQRRIPYWSYRTTGYKVYEPFMEYEQVLDEHLEKLFSGEIDDGNGDVLDRLIIDMARQAEKFLVQQRAEHRDTIKSFDIRARSDQKAFESQLTLLREQLERNQQNQEKYRELIDADEFINRRKKA